MKKYQNTKIQSDYLEQTATYRTWVEREHMKQEICTIEEGEN